VDARWARQTLLAGICGTVLGGLAGFALVGGTGASVEPSTSAAPAVIDATHLPPLLTAPGEHIDLRYDVYCDGASELEPDAACNALGTVFIRPGERGAFERLPLRVDSAAAQGRLFAEVPADMAQSRDGFSYYAVFTRPGGAGQLVIPAGGADAPQRSLPLGRSIDVRLGAHGFGRTRHADARVAEAAWGDGDSEVGLEEGRGLPPIGGSAFDVDAAGTVTLLDEAHRRLLRWTGGGRVPSRTPVDVNGTLADLAVARDGTAYVLESTGGTARSSILRAFRPDGAEISSGSTSERASTVRMGTDRDALVEQESSEQWMTAATQGRILAPAAQRASGHPGRRLPDGSELVVLRRGKELRLALVGSDGVRRSWRVTSDDPLAEVQLAEPLGNNLVVVARVYSDHQDEFEVLVLGTRGLVKSFAVESADWAETAPLARFDLVASSLYRLGSDPDGVFVDRFDLGVR
jgi:hypothetical protein